MKKRGWIIVKLLITPLFMFIISGCKTDTLSPFPTTTVLSSPTSSATSTSTPIPLTSTSTPTPTPSDTHTPTKTETPTQTITASQTNTATETPTQTPKAGTSYFPENAIKIYLTHLGTGGTVACGDSLVAIYIGHLRSGDIEKDIKIAVDTLFSIGQYSGALYNATYPSSLRVGGVILEKGIATVELGGSYLKPTDACDASRFRAQVWATILQFPEVSRAIPTYNNALLGDLLAVYSDSGK